MTSTAKHATEATPAHTQGLGEESSVWFALTPFMKAGIDNPMQILMQMADRYGPVIPINMANQRVVILTQPEHFKYVLVTKADTYIKYFDGLKPIFGKSMITNDGAPVAGAEVGLLGDLGAVAGSATAGTDGADEGRFSMTALPKTSTTWLRSIQ